MLEPNSTDFDFFLERCLYEYRENVLLLENKRWERSHLPLFSNPGTERVDGGNVSDPVATQYLRLETLDEEIARCEMKVVPMERAIKVIEMRGGTMYDFLKLKYFNRKSWKEVRASLGVSRNTIQRLKSEMISIVGRFMLRVWISNGKDEARS